MTGLQKTLKEFAEPSEESRSMDEKDSMVESSEGASMTSKGQTSARNRHARWKAGSSAGCMSDALNLVTKSMPKIRGILFSGTADDLAPQVNIHRGCETGAANKWRSAYGC